MAKEVINGNQAAASGAWLSGFQVTAVYPITPQTQISEDLAEKVAENPLYKISENLTKKAVKNSPRKVEFICVESEQSALAVCIGAEAAGVRTFTATSSEGLLYMHELLHQASGLRLPIVMVNVNRAVYGPSWILWADQQDSLSQRDTGWIQLYCEDNQEVLDTVIMAYKIGESKEILLPVMVVSEGFILSHTYKEVDVPDQKLVDLYLPPYQPAYKLDPKNPFTIGALASPEVYMEMRIQAQEAMERAKTVIEEEDRNFKKVFDRGYGVVETYGAKNPEVLLVTSGTITGTAREVIDEMASQKIGLLKIKMFRPFPTETIREILKDVRKVAVIDRDTSLGAGGIFCQEIKSALYPSQSKPQVFGFIDGLGGRDVKPENIKWVIDYTLNHPFPDRNAIEVPRHFVPGSRPLKSGLRIDTSQEVK